VIFPLIFIALGLGAVAAYEFSPRAHTWVDEHVQAIKDAALAHQVADGHLDAAASTTDPQLAQQHVDAARAATWQAVQQTTTAAQGAKTDRQRAVVAQTAILNLATQDLLGAVAALQVAKSRHIAGELEAAQKAYDATLARLARVKADFARLGAVA
jgi:hypothetical protein